jgi:hypothetical protein
MTCFSARSVVGLAFVLAALSRPARADDYHVEAATRFDTYQINVPSSPVVLTQRRLLQTLGFGYAKALGEDEAHAWGRFVSQARMRLDWNFGTDCLREGECLGPTDPRDPREYQPLARNGRLDVPELWVGLLDLPRGSSVQIGRLVATGTIGMVRYDGLAVETRPVDFLAIQAYGGAQVRAASLAGSYGFEPLGSLRLDLPDAAIPPASGFVSPPSRTYVAGVDAETLAPAFARVRLGFRESWDGDGLVLRRLAFGASSDLLEVLHAQVDAVVDLRDGTIMDVVGVLAHRTARVETRLVVERHEPRFDPGTIWGWFDLVPVATARLSTDWQVSPRLQLGAEVRGRRSDFGRSPTGEDDVERGAGGELRGVYRLPAGQVRLSGEVQGGDLGPYAAVRAYADQRLGRAASLAFTASVFHFDDRLRAGYHGLSTFASAAVGYVITREARAQLRLEHAWNPLVGHRLRVFFVLTLELWR